MITDDEIAKLEELREKEKYAVCYACDRGDEYELCSCIEVGEICEKYRVAAANSIGPLIERLKAAEEALVNLLRWR